MIKSLLKTNVLSFSRQMTMNNSSQFNLQQQTRVNTLYLRDMENIELTNDLINEDVFKSLKTLRIISVRCLNRIWIHPEVFKAFNNLKDIYFQYPSNKKMIDCIGGSLEWMKYLNADVNVSLDEDDLKEK